MKVRALVLLSVAPAFLIASTSAQAAARPGAVVFGNASAAPLMGSVGRKSIDVAANNRLDAQTGLIAGIAIIVAALGMYFAVGQPDETVSAF